MANTGNIEEALREFFRNTNNKDFRFQFIRDPCTPYIKMVAENEFKSTYQTEIDLYNITGFKDVALMIKRAKDQLFEIDYNKYRDKILKNAAKKMTYGN